MKVKFSFETAKSWVLKFRFYAGREKKDTKAIKINEKLLRRNDTTHLESNRADTELRKLLESNAQMKIGGKPEL